MRPCLRSSLKHSWVIDQWISIGHIAELFKDDKTW